MYEWALGIVQKVHMMMRSEFLA